MYVCMCVAKEVDEGMRGGFRARSWLIVTNRRKAKGGGTEKKKNGRNEQELTVVLYLKELMYCTAAHTNSGEILRCQSAVA